MSRSHAAADNGDTTGAGRNLLGRFPAFFHEGQVLDPIARGIATNRHLRKQNHSCPSRESALREFDNFLYVAAEIADCRIDLSESYLHIFSLNWVASYSQGWGFMSLGKRFPPVLRTAQDFCRLKKGSRLIHACILAACASKISRRMARISYLYFHSG